MGISDEDYGTALTELKKFKALSSEQAKAIVEAVDRLAPKQATITLEQPIQNARLSTTYPANVVATGTYIAPSTTPSGSKVLVEADLNSEAMKAPLSALVDMWTMRWQGEWVSEDAFQEDDFWRLALIRLVGANKLEKHNLASQYASVYRIID
jgi:hypothetical protein